ncbi:glycosyltransferase family 1 protein [Guyparkeria hydrothermalis]|uniref:glycosyltransferase family 4 protein n=1 Tax=Guyparkeria hydrothermalis TaxID=923 RepID=UPI0020220ABB|nr:glycosyltransferase family 1 protein [Guyparkeria hydrothermalis]MCL7745059.1 glycosyltransferase family 1 protein [Guyparkeria hydrothermalis]
MDIRLVTETYLPDINGVATTLGCLVEALRQRGHRVSVTCPRSRARRDLGDGGEVPGLALPFYPEVRFGLPRRRAFLAEWREDRPDVVHIATEGPLGASALAAARALGLPVTTSLHTNFHAYARAYRLGWLATPVMRYLRRFHNRSAGTFIPTDKQAGELAANGFERLVVLGRGVDTDRFSPARRDAGLRASWGADEHTPVLLHVGRLAAEKNLDLLIEAMDLARSVSPTTRLVIVGDGPERARLERHLPGAVFAGALRGEALARHYASADAFLFPSLTETFGIVVLEAMASGLDCLCFDYAAGRMLIEPGVNGLLAPIDAPEAFLDQVPSLLHGDPRGRRSRARETALKYGWSAVIDSFEQNLLAVVATAEQRVPVLEEQT